MTPHQKGLALTGFGAMVLTFDIPVLRLAGGDLWPVQFVRSGLGLGVALLAWGVLALARRRSALIPGRVGVATAGLYGLSAIAFVNAVFHTAAANVVFILSFNIAFAAMLGWLVLGERPARATLVTMAIMIGAVALIVGDSMRTGNLFGDISALFAAFLIAAAITLTRASGRDMGFAPMVGGILPVVLASAVMLGGGPGAETIEAPWWLILNGAVLIPLSFWCLATGPKYITGSEVAMFFLLETVLAPVWVWMIFGEVPTTPALIGGVILIAALVGHTLWQLRRERRRTLVRKRSVAQGREPAADVAKRRLAV
ncbi:DMT family transporter [Oricola cellulosilytica]|uniref:DMT family transporter n=1 Tax=Oricola cellulosilytica TaxID=1429082 RepID=A0A4R0PAW7_9HYPH|nr:DMT family transporter [Oricola cellulosilytica]TCD14380.1 DMT family transporter [Oricola cellulosilytica]